MKEVLVCKDRLKNILYSDKKENPNKIARVLKSEILHVLKNYFDVCAEDMDVQIFVNDDGMYEFNILGVSRTIKTLKTFE